MDRFVQRYLKTAIGFLALGLGLGAVMIVRRELQGVHASPYWISAHTHALLVGFVLMMIQGVALWMFPRPERGDVRYRPGLAEAAYWLVALSTGIRSGASCSGRGWSAGATMGSLWPPDWAGARGARVLREHVAAHPLGWCPHPLRNAPRTHRGRGSGR